MPAIPLWSVRSPVWYRENVMADETLVLSQVYKWSAEDRWATAPAFIPWCTVSLHFLRVCAREETMLTDCSMCRLVCPHS